MFDSSRRGKAAAIPTAAEALPDRAQAMAVPDRHFVLDAPLQPPFAQTTEEAVFGLGCFWGAERIFWQLPGVVSTAVGYAGGHTANPTYRDVCSGQTGHTEVVWVAFDPTVISYAQLLKVFFEAHDPTQGMRQGNDRGTQYRSAIYTSNPQQMRLAQDAARAYGAALQAAGRPAPVTTEIAPLQRWFFAEEYHQQYLAKNPDGYCGIGGTGVSCPIAPATAE